MAVLFKMFASLIFVFIFSSITFAIVDAKKIENSLFHQEANSCLLPPYPEHGNYTVKNYPSAKPGERYPSVKVDVSCDTGYQIENNINSILCIDGYWSATMPTCATCCTLTDDLSVEYHCEVMGPGSLKGSRECDSIVPSGTVVTPICRSPGYFSLKVLLKMHCRDGIWDYKPICTPACGTITQHRQLEGTSNNHVELPWHAVIYQKSSSGSYNQFCSGSLIRPNIIISAAHCFWSDETSKILPASEFIVAVGKLYRQYNDVRDRNSQQSNVIDIKIPSSFRVRSRYFEEDIAIVVVETPFIFHLSVRPVCIDFDYNLDGTQLREGNSGKAAIWSIADNNDQESQVLNVVDLSYIKHEDCYDSSPDYVQPYLTSDKFCVGSKNGTWPRDSGAGLAFFEPTTQRYFLRGVLSASPEFKVIPNSINMYISIIKQEKFIKQHL